MIVCVCVCIIAIRYQCSLGSRISAAPPRDPPHSDKRAGEGSSQGGGCRRGGGGDSQRGGTVAFGDGREINLCFLAGRQLHLWSADAVGGESESQGLSFTLAEPAAAPRLQTG